MPNHFDQKKILAARNNVRFGPQVDTRSSLPKGALKNTTDTIAADAQSSLPKRKVPTKTTTATIPKVQPVRLYSQTKHPRKSKPAKGPNNAKKATITIARMPSRPPAPKENPADSTFRSTTPEGRDDPFHALRQAALASPNQKGR